ncbi:hypothetical protein EVAR_56229_1 [Eumeta japonica]|uniref:Uncharacterized protein n=1 Tax=Eumeta variegata TaxID=151549 RepID=A0A4C1XFK4_EUMVA|nr:hypothetical protein EVAR_56229_1 [Eumeta japonica]
METHDSVGVTSALPASWVEIKDLIEERVALWNRTGSDGEERGWWRKVQSLSVFEQSFRDPRHHCATSVSIESTIYCTLLSNRDSVLQDSIHCSTPDSEPNRKSASTLFVCEIRSNDAVSLSVIQEGSVLPEMIPGFEPQDYTRTCTRSRAWKTRERWFLLCPNGQSSRQKMIRRTKAAAPRSKCLLRRGSMHYCELEGVHFAVLILLSRFNKVKRAPDQYHRRAEGRNVLGEHKAAARLRSLWASETARGQQPRTEIRVVSRPPSESFGVVALSE